MPNLAGFPNELLIKIFEYDVRHYRLDYGTGTGNYLNTVLDRKVGRKIYAAAKEAFWQSYVALTTVTIGELRELDDETEAWRCSPGIYIQENSGATMVQQCRNLKLYLAVSAHLNKSDYAQNYKDRLIGYLKESRNVQGIEMSLVYLEETVRDKARQLAEEVLQELRGMMNKNIKGVVTEFEMPTREVTMRSMP
jgi:hypothetical protein